MTRVKSMSWHAREDRRIGANRTVVPGRTILQLAATGFLRQNRTPDRLTLSPVRLVTAPAPLLMNMSLIHRDLTENVNGEPPLRVQKVRRLARIFASNGPCEFAASGCTKKSRPAPLVAFERTRRRLGESVVLSNGSLHPQSIGPSGAPSPGQSCAAVD